MRRAGDCCLPWCSTGPTAHLVVGHEAQQAMLADSRNVISSVKRLMGRGLADAIAQGLPLSLVAAGADAGQPAIRHADGTVEQPLQRERQPQPAQAPRPATLPGTPLSPAPLPMEAAPATTAPWPWLPWPGPCHPSRSRPRS